MTRLIITAILALTSLAAAAQDAPRPIRSEYRLEMGYGQALDTYLSPLRYSGFAADVAARWSKAMPACPEHLQMWFDADLQTAALHNPSGNATMYDLGLEGAWGMGYRFDVHPQWSILAGGSAGIGGGALCLMRNSNNPVSARIAAGINLNAEAAYRTRMGRLPLTISDRLTLPTLSVFFSPQFGETYYEIYLGNHHGLAHAGWWGNRFGIDNLLSAALRIGSRELIVGYRFRVQTSWANCLNTRRSAHMFVIGFTK